MIQSQLNSEQMNQSSSSDHNQTKKPQQIAKSSSGDQAFVQVRSDYFAALIQQQKQCKKCMQDMKKEIETLKHRVHKCEKAITKNNHNHNHNHRQEGHVTVPREFIYGERINGSLSPDPRKNTIRTKPIQPNLYATFGEAQRLGQLNSNSKRSSKKAKNQKKQSIYFKRGHSQKQREKTKKKHHNCQHHHRQKSKSKQSSVSSIASNDKLNKLRKEFQKLAKHSHTTHSQQTKISKHRETEQAIRDKLRQMQTLKSIYFLKM